MWELSLICFDLFFCLWMFCRINSLNLQNWIYNECVLHGQSFVSLQDYIVGEKKLICWTKKYVEILDLSRYATSCPNKLNWSDGWHYKIIFFIFV